MDEDREAPQVNIPKRHMSDSNPYTNNIQIHHGNSKTHGLVFPMDR